MSFSVSLIPDQVIFITYRIPNYLVYGMYIPCSSRNLVIPNVWQFHPQLYSNFFLNPNSILDYLIRDVHDLAILVTWSLRFIFKYTMKHNLYYSKLSQEKQFWSFVNLLKLRGFFFNYLDLRLWFSLKTVLPRAF